MKVNLIALLALCLLLSSPACKRGEGSEDFALDQDWAAIEKAAKGTEVQMMMWQGDPLINRYIQEFVKPQLKERFQIDLRIASGQGTQIVNLLLNEKQAGLRESAIDMAWINGETFYQLRELAALYGPFLKKLPNARLLDLDNPFIGRDFQQNIEGMEAPWGNVQMTVIYNSAEVLTPPQDLSALGDFVKANPGRFTIPSEFTGMTLLKSWMIGLFPPGYLEGDFNEERYREARDRVFNWIETHREYFWRQGQTFPGSLAQLHQLFANGEVYFTFSNNDTEVDNKIAQGIFPQNSRAYVFRSGTIQNSHYLGIVKRAQNKAGALVVINFLLSAEAQIEKLKPAVWGDGSTLNSEKLTAKQKQQFKAAGQRNYAPSRDSIAPYALPELAPEYMERLYNDFRTYIIEA